MVTVVYLVVAGMTVPETLPVARRAPLRLAPLLRNYRRLLGDVPFAGDAAAVALAFGALSVHVSASSFIAQEVLGTGTWGYAILYACYAVAVMGGSWLNAPLAGRFGPRRMLLAGQGVALAAAVAFVVVAAGRPTIVGYLVVVMIGSAAISSVLANGTALGMSRATFAAGTGAALMGCLQFTFSAVVSPLGGVAGSHTALPTALVMAGCLVASIGAGVVAAASVRRTRRRARAGVTDVQS
ncbi:MFS transporter [Microbacterium elymi]|uniref:MFS transporter n=1 Tax=Microbacterium elymi TaxID=2909587 RepID=A0ABY5NHG3_9MICO|nr:MFS transporter [Microbacterium elymi]UUT34600.1 hypothetical protein L2X98_29245 [Microbacterium elymi]